MADSLHTDSITSAGSATQTPSLDHLIQTARAKIRVGSPAKEIISEAGEGYYDLVIVGSRSTHKLLTRLLGMTIGSVVSHATCPSLLPKEIPDPFGGSSCALAAPTVPPTGVGAGRSHASRTDFVADAGSVAERVLRGANWLRLVIQSQEVPK